MKFSKYIKCILISLWLSFPTYIFSQIPTDTLIIAKQLRAKGLYKQEFEILQKYRNTHTQNTNIEWLYGQSAFSLGKTKQMINIYESNILLNSDNYFLKLDYAYNLLALGQLKKAKYLLELAIPLDSTNSKIYASLAKIAYWQSNYNRANSYITTALKIDPENHNYIALRNDIANAKSAWVEFGAEYYNDNQPLLNVTPFFKAGLYKNQYFKLQASVHSSILKSNSLHYDAQFYKIKNTSVFAETNLILNTELGVVSYPNEKTNLTALVQLDKTILNTLTFSVIAERKPYLSMLSSIDTCIATSDFTASVKWESKKGILAQTAYTHSQFSNNNITTTSAWMVSPLLKLGAVGLRGGYGYSYTDSKNDMYNSVQSADDLSSQIYTNNNVKGAFIPYLTPKELQTHSLIGVINYDIANKINISISGSYGFLASIQKPYLIGYYNEQGKVEISKFYYKESFTALELTTNVNFKISPNIHARFKYQHGQPNNYYTSNYAFVGIKYILNNE